MYRAGLGSAMEQNSYECFCGTGFGHREELISHNVKDHGWNEGESRRSVLEKYPEA